MANKLIKVSIVIAIVILLFFTFDLYPKVFLPIIDMMIKPRDGEADKIEEILSVENEVLSICEIKIAKYTEEFEELGIEMKVTIVQRRGLYGARVEPYNLQEKQRIPRRYSSQVSCDVYKNGERLSKQEEYNMNVTTLYGTWFQIVQSWNPYNGNNEIWYNENPLEDFDTAMEVLLNKIRNDFGQ